jgi:hypothetical protein
MARKLRIAAIVSLIAAGLLVSTLIFAYIAVRSVRPFYQQALRAAPDVLEERSRELESRATALYSDARKAGRWSALFTADQINGWLATQLRENRVGRLPEGVRDPRVAIAPDSLTLGFRTAPGGIETVASVDTSVFLTEEGAVAVRFQSVRAGSLPLPTLHVADEVAAACRALSLPVRWMQLEGQPVAIVELRSDSDSDKLQFHIDTIELGEGEMYVAGHTESREASDVEFSDYELRVTPNDKNATLEIAHRPAAETSTPSDETSPSSR